MKLRDILNNKVYVIKNIKANLKVERKNQGRT